MKWPSTSFTRTVADDAEPQADYDVQAYLVHRHDAHGPVSTGMCSGHYVAYFKHGTTWYLADDAKVSMLTGPPTEFPYVVFLARSDRASGSHMSALQKRIQGIKKARREAPELPRSSPEPPVVYAAGDQAQVRASLGAGETRNPW